MEIEYTIVYHPEVMSADIPNLPKVWKGKIKLAIENKLVTAPETFGKPLRRSLSGYRRLRVGDYRIVYRIVKETVKIFVIQHRSVVYESSVKKSRE